MGTLSNYMLSFCLALALSSECQVFPAGLLVGGNLSPNVLL